MPPERRARGSFAAVAAAAAAAAVVRRVAFAAVLLATASAVHAVQDCDMGGESVNPANGHTTAGKTGLMRCKDRDSGLPTRDQQVQNGVFMGLVRFYEQGRVIKEHSVNVRGNLDGRAREFSPTGQLLREAVYEDGQEVGLVRSFHPSGAPRRLAFHAERGERAAAEFTESGRLSALRCGEKRLLAPAFDDERACGFAGGASQVELYDGKGVLRSRLSFAAGKRVRSEELYDNGKPSVQIELAGDQRTERRWTSDGVKRREIVSRVTERGSIRQREQEFSEGGTLVREQRWNPSGEPSSDQRFYLNGQPRSRTLYADGGTPGSLEVTEFHDNGQRAAVGRFVAEGRFRQIPVGTHQRFGDDGRLRAESTYDERGRLRREVAWNAAGVLERDDEVFEDGSRKAYAK